MSTIVSLTIDKNHRKARLVIQCDQVGILWDNTNKCWKSGGLKSVLTGLSSSSGLNSGDSMKITITPPNFNPNCHAKVEQLWNTSALSLPSSFTHINDINFGQPDGSANVNEDGTIDCIYIDLELSIGATSSHIITATYTAPTLTVVDTYAPLGSANPHSMVLALEPEMDRNWGTISLDVQGATGIYVVQLTSIVSNVTLDDYPSLSESRPVLSIMGVPNQNGQDYLMQYPLPIGQGRTKNLINYYTRVFALNGGKISPNALNIITPIATYGAQYDFLNVGLTKDLSSKTKAAITLNYSDKVVSL